MALSVCELATIDDVTEIFVAGAGAGVTSCDVIIMRYNSILHHIKMNHFWNVPKENKIYKIV